MSNELNMLDNTNRLFADNIRIAETKCVVNTTLNYVNSELTLAQTALQVLDMQR